MKVSYHPRWRVQGGDGPYLVSPALMLVVPRSPTVTLTYGRDWSDAAGAALTVVGLLAGAWSLRRRRSATEAAVPVLDACAVLPAPSTRWGGLIPGAILLLLAGSRFLGDVHLFPPDPEALYEEASRQYAAQRYDAALSASTRALESGAPSELKAELLCLEGESLLRLGRFVEAVRAFDAVIEGPRDPHLAQALSGAARARAGLGDESTAASLRRRLEAEFGDTPWARPSASDPRP